MGELTVSTSRTTLHRAAATAVLAGAAVLTAAPAQAGPYPVGGTTPDLSGRRSQAQGEAAQGPAQTTGPSSPRVREREAQQDLVPSPRPGTTRTPEPSDPSSVPLSVLALLGTSLVAGAAGVTVHRFRHHGPAEAATA
jgi:hypothetical protein